LFLIACAACNTVLVSVARGGGGGGGGNLPHAGVSPTWGHIFG